ncbi:helix-turn-helix transcriptional regulator [Nocardiopsis valliformis]|uniref:helix-turn-helix transcriptional regulator n=1 Tax=Nocardiopsis valliformis TaxID=239974 RepID=UPI00034DCF11|nr:helix-turn-helix transcriptional regulator [Nocardiopsis valliformis]
MGDMPLLSDTSPVFVGRLDHLRLLTDQAHRVRTGPPEMLLVGGDAGVGKSRLVAEFAATRPPGTVFLGACLQLGVDGLSYAPFTAVLRQILRERGRPPFESAAPGGIGEFARLLPELGEPSADRRENRGILFEQVLRLFDQVAGDDGITVVLEDLHWADGATRDLLVFLARNLDRPGTQIVATYRSDDLHRSHPLRRLLPELERLPRVGRIVLEPLTREEVGRQAAAIRGEVLGEDALNTLYQRSEGVPLFVEALAAADSCPDDDPDLPDHFRDLFLEPLHRFDESAMAVLRVAAVGAVADSIEHEFLYHAAGLPEHELEAALHTLVDANVLRPGRTGYRFRHALLRDAVHEEILPGPHSRLHLRFAQLIDEYPEAVPVDRRAAEQAHHYQAAQDLPRAMEAAWWAAVQAKKTLAFDERLDMLERVLALWDRVPDPSSRVEGLSWAAVVSRAANTAISANRSRRALELVDEALATLPGDATDDETLTTRAVLLRQRGQARANHVRDGGIVDLIRALELHPPHMPGYSQLLAILARECALLREDRAQTLEQRILRELAESGRGPRSLAEMAIEAADTGSLSDACAAADARITLGGAYMQEGDMERGRPLMERGLAEAKKLRQPHMEARGAGNLGHFLRELGHHEEGLRVLDESLARHESLGWAPAHKSFNHQNRAEIYLELGDLRQAREIFRLYLRSGQRNDKHQFYIQAVEARAAAAMGDTAAARDAAGPVGDRSMLDSHRMNILQLRAMGALDAGLAEGDLAEVLSLSWEVLEQVALECSPGYTWPLLDQMAEATRLGSEQGRTERGNGTENAETARRVRALIARTAGKTPVTGLVHPAHAASVTALLAEGEGTAPAELAELWAAAVRAWERTPMRLHLARAQLREAEARVAAGERGAAVLLTRQVYETATECGAAPLARAAEDLARRLGTGLSEESVPPPAPAGLTGRETEVLRLLASGATNADIAAELFISPKTASVHVSNILGKLDVPNRATAGARARELGLV